VSGIQQLNVKQRELTAECVPSSAEISFVDNAVKEWAKTGAMSAEDVRKKLNRRDCGSTNGYESSVRYAVATGLEEDICYNTFTGYGNDGMVWAGYPKVGLASYCDDGSDDCKNKKTKSDIYEIFNLVDFGEADYTRQEATMAAKLISKIENCSDARLSQKKRAMWGDFLISTIGSVGQKTNTGTIMDTVGNITKSGTNLTGGLSSLGSVATQFLNK
jgi:hypothetical protein